MELKKLKSLYDDLLKDIEFDKLELGLHNPNIFEVLRISKTEIRHSNFLSWLLNPNGSHQLGDVFLKRFLREVFLSDKFNDINQVDVEGMDFSNVEIHREWNHIDILIKLENIVVCIENKILSKEHSDQLTRYKKIIESNFPKEKKTFVYLSPEGNPSENESDVYQPISFNFIIDSLERIISVYGKSMNQQVLFYIKDYITIIKRELMGTDELSQLSQKIYNNHKELFDFIEEHKPDTSLRLSTIIRNQIEERGWILGSYSTRWIRFYTPKIKDFIYYTNKSIGWKNGESYSFEIDLYNQNKITFRSVISPCDEKYNRKRLEEIISSIEGFKKTRGVQWSTNKSKSIPFDFENIFSMTDDEIKEKINPVLDKLNPIIKLLEDKLLSHSDELIKMTKV
jgi:hypothetical protein